MSTSPILVKPLPDQSVRQGFAFSYPIALDAFVDPDAADVLRYTATLSDGSALPQWLSFSSIQLGFTGTPAQADVGTLNIKLTATDSSGASVSDVFMLEVLNVNDAPTGSLLIVGTAVQGQTLRLSSSIKDLDGLGPISYQWLADGDAIEGATGSTLVLGQALVGKVITATATYTDGFGTLESVTSDETTAVKNIDDPTIGSVSITGPYAEGGTVHADTSGLSDADGLLTLAYQWQISDDGKSGWTDLPGAVADSYAIASDESQVGRFIRVLVTASDPFGSSQQFVSGSQGQLPGFISIRDLTLTENSVGNTVVQFQVHFGGNQVEGSGIQGALIDLVYDHSLVTAAQVISPTFDADDGFGGIEAKPIWSLIQLNLSGSQANGKIAVVADSDVANPIVDSTGSAFTVKLLVTGVVSEFPVQLQAIELGGESYIATADGVICVVDVLQGPIANVNDAPAITSGTTATVAENTAASTVIYTATASDVDSGDTKTYSLGGTDASLLTIDSSTGEVTLKASANYEAKSSYSFDVVVTDSGGLTGTQAVTLSVTDVNEAPTGEVTISGQTVEKQTLAASNTLDDPDGLGVITYQWQRSLDAGDTWSDITGATQATYLLTDEDVRNVVRVQVSYTDAHGTLEAVASLGALVDPANTVVNVQAYLWNTHTLISGVSLALDTQSTLTDATGFASLEAPLDQQLDLTAQRSSTEAEQSAMDGQVNLNDAIAILKMIVGLPINANGAALSPYQALAADFDGNGVVQLTDAIGVLKHVVGLTSPEPSWQFVDERNLDVAAITQSPLSPGQPPAIAVDTTGAASTMHVGLVGYIRGDVNGSYVGLVGVSDLDLTQPDYFLNLTLATGLDLSQFGIY